MKKNSQSGGITTPRGFRAAGGYCGIKASGAPDLTLIVADVPSSAAAVFTTNQVCGAPVIINKMHLSVSGSMGQAIICSSGNSNSGTGKQGERDALAMCKATAAALGCRPSQVFPNSTGVIGRPLPMQKILPGIAKLASQLDRGPKADAAAARGIMTTDLVPKSAHRKLSLGGKTVHLAGICKGSGMIAPNMATMLAFLTTDAAITPGALQAALKIACGASFNRISVDQHESPSDTLLILASGLAGNKEIRGGRRAERGEKGDFAKFTATLTDLCKDLAYQIVKDGEGATKVFRVIVRGAESEADADRVGRTVVDSLLVKTAVHGGDPNWGRITTAAGYSGARIDPGKMSLHIGAKREVCVFRGGAPTTAGANPSAKLRALMALKEVVFTLDLGLGQSQVEWLGCDLSREYIRINADYTT